MTDTAKHSAIPFGEQIESLDLKLFDAIPSQTTQRDKHSLLACQLAVRTLCQSYAYLEIGSYLGGSLQPYLVDPRCTKIFSIDRRPATQPDARGIDYAYKNNSTERMLANLAEIDGPGLSKITCFDADASGLQPQVIVPKPRVCFIDGEHTDEACFKDCRFCLDVLEHDGVIVFHDAQIVYNGLIRVVALLNERRIRYHAYHLPDTVFVVEINDFAIHKLPFILAMLIDNHEGYLKSLRLNDHYRQLANRPLLKWLRNLKARLDRSNVSK